jgi:hypothetical protein
MNLTNVPQDLLTGTAGPKSLHFKVMNSRLIYIESQSETLGYHPVKLDRHGLWTCDCKRYEFTFGCAHIDCAEDVAKRIRQHHHLNTLKEIYAEVNG